MDALSDVLRTMRLKGGVFLRGHFTAPWCLSVDVSPQTYAPFFGETADVIPYHFVVEGHLQVGTPDGVRLDLGPGDSVLFTRNDQHLLGSDVNRRAEPAGRFSRSGPGGLLYIDLDGPGDLTRIVCGFLAAERVAGNPVLSALPPVLYLRAGDNEAAAWMQSTFQYAAEQIGAGRPGSATTMSKISELLFVEAVQRYVDTLPEGATGWLAGMRDPYVSRALALMHGNLRRAWTVEDLGREVGLSRSALGARFGEVMGMPPMQYLANWRIHAAAHELLANARSVAQVAEDVGYESEASLTRAFKRVMGAPPATWRRQRLQADSPG